MIRQQQSAQTSKQRRIPPQRLRQTQPFPLLRKLLFSRNSAAMVACTLSKQKVPIFLGTFLCLFTTNYLWFRRQFYVNMNIDIILEKSDIMNQLINEFNNILKNFDKQIIKICKKCLTFIFYYCIIASLILITYKFYNSPDLFFIGITLLKYGLIYSISTIIFSMAFNQIKTDLMWLIFYSNFDILFALLFIRRTFLWKSNTQGTL